MQNIIFREFHDLAFRCLDWCYFLCDFRAVGKLFDEDMGDIRLAMTKSSLFRRRKSSRCYYFAAGFTLRRSMRAIELYSKPVNFGLSMVLSAFQ